VLHPQNQALTCQCWSYASANSGPR